MRLYFAYGSNMVAAQMAQRCPAALRLGTALLPNHRFLINRAGYATVAPQPGSDVRGVVWRLGRGAEAALDRYEAVADGLYRRAFRRIRRDGRAVTALVYIAADPTPGRPRPGYLEPILAAAAALGFAADYVRELESWRSRPGGSPASAIARTSAGVRPASRSARSVSA